MLSSLGCFWLSWVTEEASHRHTHVLHRTGGCHLPVHTRQSEAYNERCLTVSLSLCDRRGLWRALSLAPGLPPCVMAQGEMSPEAGAEHLFPRCCLRTFRKGPDKVDQWGLAFRCQRGRSCSNMLESTVPQYPNSKHAPEQEGRHCAASVGTCLP